MKLKTILLFFFILTILFFHKTVKDLNINSIHQIRDSIDELEDVEIFYNGSIRHIENRNITKDGYNLGLRW